MSLKTKVNPENVASKDGHLDYWECFLSADKNCSAIKLKKVKKPYKPSPSNIEKSSKGPYHIFDPPTLTQNLRLKKIQNCKKNKNQVINAVSEAMKNLVPNSADISTEFLHKDSSRISAKFKRKKALQEMSRKFKCKVNAIEQNNGNDGAGNFKSKKKIRKAKMLQNLKPLKEKAELPNRYFDSDCAQGQLEGSHGTNLENVICHVNGFKVSKLAKKRRHKHLSISHIDPSTKSKAFTHRKGDKTNGNCTFPSDSWKSLKINNSVFETKLYRNRNNNNNAIAYSPRHSLPIFSVRESLIQFVLQNDTSILVGETGCGKSTQVPQFLYEEGLYQEGIICITQPRKLAATSLAKRVSEEVGTELGDLVGYSVRFEEKVSERTKLKYVTDGMLLREALSDPLFLRYEWIILDEAHERTVNTDILFGIVKEAQKNRKLQSKKELRVIVMSATMDIDHFIAYFDNADAKVIVGRQFEIDYTFVSNSEKDYYLMCLSLLLKLHTAYSIEKGILIFLTGQEEIENFVRQVNDINEEQMYTSVPSIEAYPLYAQLPDHEQMKIFKTPSPGKRKVIVSTNLAETSITIPGISVVIDSCHVKTRSQNPNTGFEELIVEKISLAQAFQRAGRSGREGPGYYFSALTKSEFESLKENPTPDVLKADLSSTFFTLLSAGVKDVMKFDFLDRPPQKHLQLAESDLRDLKIIVGFGNNTQLTDLGQKLKYLPLKPNFGKVILLSADLQCSEQILTIVSLLSCETIYVNRKDKLDEAKLRRRRFYAVEGDHITLLNVFNAFEAATNRKAWCRKNFLNFRNLEYACNIRRQLLAICKKIGIPMLSCQLSSNPYKVQREPVLKSLIGGLFKNVAKHEYKGKYKCLSSNQEVFIHPSSLLFGEGAEFILFTNVTSTGKQYMNINSVIEPRWLQEMCPHFYPFIREVPQSGTCDIHLPVFQTQLKY